ncbi:class I SAM-dependent methyltransferase [Nitrincola sp.]|uniref:class I SAM-dependent methyltransferase n=1 Tax=Nitrincola sp. TaxID=1926584 RepID=UPI003A916C94
MQSEQALLACGWQESAFAARAELLAAQLKVPVVQLVSLQDLPFAYLLLCDASGLALQMCGKKPPGPVRADFVSGAVAHRRQFGGGQGQMIAKACGLAKGIRPSVADVTAGLGRDAFVLASLGCQVQLVERSALVHLLLEDGLVRAAEHYELKEIISRMALVHADALDWLQQQASLSESMRPQVVYLDPMFPHRDKTALVKKEMLLFRDLVGDDADADGLLEAALAVAQCRVVVKRPRKAPCLLQREPAFRLEGKSSRYDVYSLKKLF